MNKSLIVLNLKYEKLAELYDNTPLRARNITCTTKVNEIAQLTFKIPINNPKTQYLLNEHLIDYNNEYYVIKTTELEHSDDGTIYCLCTCSHLSCTLQNNTMTIEEVTPKTPAELMKVALLYENGSPTLGWSVGTVEFGDYLKRGLSISEQSVFSVLCSVAESFGGMLRFRSKDRQVDLLKLENPFYFKSQFVLRKNLKGLKVSYDTSELVTRLYCIGGELEDGTEMNIMKVNPTGKPYIQNFEYYEKLGYTSEDIEAHPELFIKTGIFRDTNQVLFAEDLLNDGIDKLRKVAYPKVEVNITALDTSFVDEYQPALNLNIGDFVKVIDPELGVNFECYVIEKTYDDEQPHVLNLTVANDIDFKDIVSDLFASANTSSQVITPGGVIQGSHINSISTTQIRNLDVEYCSIDHLTANYIDAESIASTYAKISDLEALDIEAINIKTENLIADNASIKGLLAGNIMSEEFSTIHLTADNVEIDEAVIKDIIASKISVDDLKAGEIDVAKLFSNQAEIINLLAGNIGSELIQAIHLTTDNVVIDEAVIDELIVSKISVDDILANNIDTREIYIVSSDDGSGINIKDQTMQFVDSDGNVRIQIGQDATGEFSFVLTGANGTQLLTESGLQAGAIANNFIKNEMVDDNAIKSRNIDWASSGATVDENGNPVWDIASLTMNNEMFEVSFNKLTESVNDNAKNIESLGTDITTIQGQISSRIWDSDITNAINEYDNTEIKTIRDQYSVINQELEQITLTVGDVQTSIGELNNELASAVSKITINEGAISSVVSKADENSSSILSLQQTAQDLIVTIKDAEKTATNYLKFDNGGLIIGNLTVDTLYRNVFIDTDSVDIRNGTVVLASFTEDSLSVGNKTSTSRLDMGGGFVLKAFEDNSSRIVRLAGEGIAPGFELESLFIDLINYADTPAENEHGLIKIHANSHEIRFGKDEGLIIDMYSGDRLGDNVYINSESVYFRSKTPSGTYDGTTFVNINGSLDVSGEITGTLRKLSAKSNSRIVNADTYSSAEINTVFYYPATSSMIQGKPPWDSHVLDFHWDNMGGYNAQLAVRNNAAGLALRGCNAGTWGAWTQVSLDGHSHSNYIDATSTQTVTGAKTFKAANVFDGEQKFYNTSYCPTVNDIASGVGCSMKNARACNNQMIAAEIFAPYTAASDSTLNMTSTAGQLEFYKITSVSGGKITGKQNLAALNGDGFILPNSKPIYMKNTSAKPINVMYIGSDNNLLIGKGTYDADSGATHIYSGGNIQLYINNGGTQVGVTFGTSAVIPLVSGGLTLGTSSKKWGAVWSTNASIQTSDRREKENIIKFGANVGNDKLIDIDLHSELFDRLIPVQFNYTQGNKRICYGLIAQDIVDAMHEIGIEENELDLVHHDFWKDDNGNDCDSYGVAYGNLLAMLIYEVQKLKKQIKSIKA